MLDVLSKLMISEINLGAGTGSLGLDCGGEMLESISPVDGRVLARVLQA